MAGVVGECRECGWPIFDEQTRTKLCDECLKLPPEERLSGKRERERLEKQNAEIRLQQAREEHENWLTNLRRVSEERERRYREPPEQNALPFGVTQSELRELVEKAKKYDELQRQKEEETPQEVKSFLRKFDNLDVESEI